MEWPRLINEGDLSAGHQACLKLSVVDLTYYVYVGVTRREQRTTSSAGQSKAQQAQSLVKNEGHLEHVIGTTAASR